MEEDSWLANVVLNNVGFKIFKESNVFASTTQIMHFLGGEIHNVNITLSIKSKCNTNLQLTFTDCNKWWNLCLSLGQLLIVCIAQTNVWFVMEIIVLKGSCVLLYLEAFYTWRLPLCFSTHFILAMMATEHLMPYMLFTSCKQRRNLVGYY